MADSNETIKVDYEKLNQMQATFTKSAEQLQQINQAMKKVAADMTGGALVGQGGQAFATAIQGKLCPCIDRLDQKFGELVQDLKYVEEKAREADQNAQQAMASIG